MKPFFRQLIPVSIALLLAIPVPVSAQGGHQGYLRLTTVAIDPGHGGKDPGCVSADGKTYEKTITLDIAKRLAQKIESSYQDVEVVMTRRDDRFVELEKRAVTANKANADLFISIHVNSAGKATSASGYSIHVLGQSQKKGNDLYSKNLDLVKRENSVIMMEENYQTKYQGFDPNDPQSSIIFSLMQNAYLNASLGFAEDVTDAMALGPIKNNRGVSQDPFWVLWRTAMPAVLIEVGFMSNPKDLATLRSEKGREAIATNIFNAFWAFKTRYDKTDDVAEMKPQQPLPEPVPEPVVEPVVEEKPVQKETPKTTVEEKPKTVVEEKPVQEEKPKTVVEEKPKTVVEEKPKKVEEAKPEEVVVEEKASPVYYGIQISAVGKPVRKDAPFFKGYAPQELKVDRLYKYVVCTSSSLEEVRKNLPKVKADFKECFLVKIENGIPTRVR